MFIVFINISSSEYRTLNGKMITSEKGIGKDMDGNSCGLISCIVLAFTEGTEEKNMKSLVASLTFKLCTSQIKVERDQLREFALFGVLHTLGRKTCSTYVSILCAYFFSFISVSIQPIYSTAQWY